jgi:DNA primase-like protein
LVPVWDHSVIATTEERRGIAVTDDLLDGLLSAAAEFFETQYWESEGARAARDTLARHGLEEKVIRRFGVGYAPVAYDELLTHLRDIGYSTDEVVAAGLASRSRRGQVHAHFRSRITFPIRDRSGQVLGFAGLGTHLGPSWPMWVVSPDAGLYRRSEAVFGIDRAAKAIKTSKTAVVLGDCIAVLLAHQSSVDNAVTVHTSGVTPEQIDEMAVGLPGGSQKLELDLRGIGLEPELDLEAISRDTGPTAVPRREPPPHAAAKRLSLTIATALVAINTWTGAPLLAIWTGAHAQNGRVISFRGVVTVLVTLVVLEFLLGVALTWLSLTYDRVTGRPRFAGVTSPWHRAKRGDRVQDIRARFGMSAPEKIVAACVIFGFLAFEVWFFFLAGSSLPNQ